MPTVKQNSSRKNIKLGLKWQVQDSIANMGEKGYVTSLRPWP